VATNNCYLSLLGFAGFSKLIQLVTSTNSAFLSYFYKHSNHPQYSQMTSTGGFTAP